MSAHMDGLPRCLMCGEVLTTGGCSNWARPSKIGTVPIRPPCLDCAALRSQLAAAVGRAETLTAERDALRETNKRLQRRAQEAEGIIAKSGIVEDRPQQAKGSSLGRALANYAAAQCERERDELRAVLESLHASMTTWVGDWSKDKTLAWVYGVIVGWDDALDEVAALHGWSSADAARLANLHDRVVAARKGDAHGSR